MQNKNNFNPTILTNSLATPTHNEFNNLINRALIQILKDNNTIALNGGQKALRNAAIKFKEMINDIIKLEGPREYSEPFSCGAFKEVYRTPIDGWVIKFCDISNPTDKELEIYRQARLAKLDKYFANTFFIPLPKTLTAFCLESVEIDSSTKKTNAPKIYRPQLNRLIIQRKIDVICDTFNSCDIWEEKCKEEGISAINFYNEDPIIWNDRSIMDYECFVSLDIDKDWIQNCIFAHGDESVIKFLQFCEKHSIADLHTGNIGYERHFGNYKPVIIDWLSY